MIKNDSELDTESDKKVIIDVPVKSYDDILEIAVGSDNNNKYTRWQFLICFLIGLYGLSVSSINDYSMLFIGATPEHWCTNNALVTSPKNQFIPHKTSNSTDEFINQCHIYNNKTQPQPSSALSIRDNTKRIRYSCNSWHYDRSQFNSTIVTKWNLVCDRRIIYKTIESFGMLGLAIGSILFASIGDRIGRKRIALSSVILITITNTLIAFAPNETAFIVLKLISTASIRSGYLATFVILIEISSVNRRANLCLLITIPYVLGIAILTGLAYLIRIWWHLQLIITIPFSLLLLFLYLWLLPLPESPRWLIIKGRLDEAMKILRSITNIQSNNKQIIPSSSSDMQRIVSDYYKKRVFENQQKQNQILKRFDLMYIFRYGGLLRKTTLVTTWLLVTCNIASSNMLNNKEVLVKNDIYLNVFLIALLQIPITLILILLVNYFGRRSSLILAYVTSALALLSVPLLSSIQQIELTKLASIISIAAKQLLNVTNYVVLIYASEIFPTTIRCAAIGCTTMLSSLNLLLYYHVINLLEKQHWSIPYYVISFLAIVSAIAVLILPETKGTLLPDTILNNCEQKSKTKQNNNKNLLQQDNTVIKMNNLNKDKKTYVQNHVS